ncbi:MAG: hypothetical protein R6T96_11620 [Longimicrobiales bacterium]
MDQRSIRISFFFAFFILLFFPATEARSQEREYTAMEDVQSVVKTAFDFRVGDSDVALGHLDLIHAMLDDPSMVKQGEKPEIVIVFIGPSVSTPYHTRHGCTAAGRYRHRLGWRVQHRPHHPGNGTRWRSGGPY